MNVLIAFYSRTGYTKELALIIAEELVSRGHEVELEKIEPVKEDNLWPLLWRTQWYWGALALGILSNRYREYFISNYRIPEVDIKPLAHPDVSKYDRVCIGCGKQTIVPCTIEAYLRQVKGLKGKKVGGFATWAGPPLKHFEVEHLFRPIADRLERRGASLVSIVGLSSRYHEYHNQMLNIFEFLSRVRYGKPISYFSVHSDYGRQHIKLFCDELVKGTTDIMDSRGWRRSFQGTGILGVASASSWTTLERMRTRFEKKVLDKA